VREEAIACARHRACTSQALRVSARRSPVDDSVLQRTHLPPFVGIRRRDCRIRAARPQCHRMSTVRHHSLAQSEQAKSGVKT
jgi:hypothetical protein